MLLNWSAVIFIPIFGMYAISALDNSNSKSFNPSLIVLKSDGLNSNVTLLLDSTMSRHSLLIAKSINSSLYSSN